MHITCVICSDLITGTDETFVTNCGHLFHYNCVIQWFERSKTCPQCRGKTSEKNIHRVYFNIANIEGADDPSFLQSKIDNMKFQMKLKDMDIKNAKEASSDFQAKNKALRAELRELEEKIATSNTAISALKGQLRHMKIQNQRMDELREENRALQSRLETMKGLETIKNGSPAEVDELLNSLVDSSSEARSLATYCSSLKRELQGMVEKRKLTQVRMKEYNNNLSKAYAERDSMKEAYKMKLKEEAQMKEELSHAIEERCRLEKKIKEWGGYFERVQRMGGQSPALDMLSKLALTSPSKEHTATEMLRMLTESPAPEDLLIKLKSAIKATKHSNPLSPKELFPKGRQLVPEALTTKLSSTPLPQERPMLSDPALEEAPKSFKIARTLTESQQRQDSKINNTLNKKGFSIFSKPRLCSKPEEVLQKASEEEIYYDGMGGHKRPELFPNPKRPKMQLGAKPKVKKPPTSQNKPTSLPSIENFLDRFPS